MSHTLATLEISAQAHAEISAKLRESGYGHAFLEDGLVDMTGIGLVAGEPEPASARYKLLARCLSVLSTLEGDDTTEQEMLECLQSDVMQAMRIQPLVRGG